MPHFGTLASIAALPHGKRISNWPIEAIVDLLQDDFGDFDIVASSESYAHWRFNDVEAFLELKGPSGPYEDMVDLSIKARSC